MTSLPPRTPEEDKYLQSAIQVCRENNILLPTFKMLGDPSLIPQKVKDELKKVGIAEINPLNLFRISWFNERKPDGGLYNRVPNFIEVPKELTGVRARIVMLCGKFFPTGAHKVGSSYGPLATRLATGKFDPRTHTALWPSTGNYCRGGAFNAALLHTPCIAILPEGMSRERFDWLKAVHADIATTCPPADVAPAKALFDLNDELVREGAGRVVSFNQFVDPTNPIFHYWCTGRALEQAYLAVATPTSRLSGLHLAQGSGGCITGAARYLRKKFPRIKVAAGEALQCPTLLANGFGAHRIEGIGDGAIPWVLDVKNIDVATAIDDEDVVRVMHLFNHPAGKAYLKEKGVPDAFIAQLGLLGISSIANLLGCIKEAKLFEFNENDVVLSVCTDSMDMYQSRVNEHKGEYVRDEAVATYAQCLMGQKEDHCLELTYAERKKCHNLKYFMWVEQRGRTAEELNAQWYDDHYWDQYLSEACVDKYDSWINEFNRSTGLAEKYGVE